MAGRTGCWSGNPGTVGVVISTAGVSGTGGMALTGAAAFFNLPSCAGGGGGGVTMAGGGGGRGGGGFNCLLFACFSCGALASLVCCACVVDAAQTSIAMVNNNCDFIAIIFNYDASGNVIHKMDGY